MLNNSKCQKGFTLIEILVAVAIVAILAAIAYPSYQNYVIKTKRGDMMTELQNIASQIEAKKLAIGSYSKVDISSLVGDYPKTGSALYTVSVESQDQVNNSWQNGIQNRNWRLVAAPKSGGMMAQDGDLSYSSTGVKCRASRCGMGDEWRDN